MTMTMDEMKKAIARDLKTQYGFAPALKDIRPLETSGYGKNKYECMAFHINGKGYIYNAYGIVIKAPAYDMNNEQ